MAPSKIVVEVVIKTDKPRRVQTEEHKANIKAAKAAAKAHREAIAAQAKAREIAEKALPRIITCSVTGASKPMPLNVARQLGYRV